MAAPENKHGYQCNVKNLCNSFAVPKQRGKGSNVRQGGTAVTRQCPDTATLRRLARKRPCPSGRRNTREAKTSAAILSKRNREKSEWTRPPPPSPARSPVRLAGPLSAPPRPLGLCTRFPLTLVHSALRHLRHSLHRGPAQARPRRAPPVGGGGPGAGQNPTAHISVLTCIWSASCWWIPPGQGSGSFLLCPQHESHRGQTPHTEWVSYFALYNVHRFAHIF